MSELQAAAVVAAAIVACIGAVVGAWLAFKASDRANEIKDKQVDREEFDAITRELRASLNDARLEIADAKNEAKASRAETATLRGELKDERSAHRNTRRVLTEVIEQNRVHSEWDERAARIARLSDPSFPDPPQFVEPDFA